MWTTLLQQFVAQQAQNFVDTWGMSVSGEGVHDSMPHPADWLSVLPHAYSLPGTTLT